MISCDPTVRGSHMSPENCVRPVHRRLARFSLRRAQRFATATLIATLMLATLVPAGHQPSAACPTDTLAACGVVSTSTASSGSVVGCGSSNAGASYDLISGQLIVGVGGQGADAEVTTEDVYTLAGSGSPGLVAFVAQFSVVATLTYYAAASAEIRGDGEFQQFATGSCICFPGITLTQTLSLPLSHAVGEPFHMNLNVTGVCPNRRGFTSNVTATGELAFVLPPGITVFSCQGYSTPVAVRARSWGRVKTLYR